MNLTNKNITNTEELLRWIKNDTPERFIPKLNIGDIIERHVVNEDWVLFNRQPTLHKPSMMGHRAHVIDREDCNTLRVNVSVCGPYNADRKYQCR
jgi:DNA-directed RNA polymerase beta' subunit